MYVQCHLSKRLQHHHADALPHQNEQLERLQDYEDWVDEDLNIALDLLGVGKKGDYSDAQLKALVMETLDRDYNYKDTWTQVFVDGSAVNAVRSGGVAKDVKSPIRRRPPFVSL